MPSKDEQQTARAPASPRNTDLPAESESITSEPENGALANLLANRTAIAATLALAALGGGGFALWKRRRTFV